MLRLFFFVVFIFPCGVRRIVPVPPSLFPFQISSLRVGRRALICGSWSDGASTLYFLYLSFGVWLLQFCTPSACSSHRTFLFRISQLAYGRPGLSVSNDVCRHYLLRADTGAFSLHFRHSFLHLGFWFSGCFFLFRS